MQPIPSCPCSQKKSGNILIKLDLSRKDSHYKFPWFFRYEVLLRYGLYLGAAFQLCCILAVLISPSSDIRDADSDEDSSSEESEIDDIPSDVNRSGQKNRKRLERKKRRWILSFISSSITTWSFPFSKTIIRYYERFVIWIDVFPLSKTNFFAFCRLWREITVAQFHLQIELLKCDYNRKSKKQMKNVTKFFQTANSCCIIGANPYFTKTA